MIQSASVVQKQELLDQRRRNLKHLEKQVALHGIDVPLAVHNALIAEQDAIAILERELAANGVSPQPEPQWQALVIDTDDHWRQIVNTNISRLGGTVVERNVLPVRERKILNTSAMAVLGVPHHTSIEGEIGQWIKDVVKLGRHMPIILLVCNQNKDTAIALRQAISKKQQPDAPVTIFKDNFDPNWFSRVVHKILIQ